MPIREDTYLPSDQELTVPEINVTSSVFKAASLYVGKHCDNVSKEFMLCKKESEGDPRMCINEGKEVTRCGMDFFRTVKANCYESFTKYWKCLDNASNRSFKLCRESQKAFDQCIGTALQVERPEPGYFCKVRVVDTDRPRPQFDRPKLPEEPETYVEEKKEPRSPMYKYSS